MPHAHTSEEHQHQHDHFESMLIRRMPDHPVIKAFAAQRLRELRSEIDFSQIKNILDIGAGHGHSSVHLQELAPVVAADFSLRLLKLNPSPDKVWADARALPFPDRSFDMVSFWEVLHHLEEPLPALNEAVRVSNRYVVVFEPNVRNPAQWAFGFLQPEHRMMLQYTPAFYRELVQKAGLRVSKEFRGGWVLPNRMPGFIVPPLAKLPYRWPLGISTILICERT